MAVRLNPLAINSGTLRHQVSIQRQTGAQDGNGDPTQTWETVLTTRAAIATQSQREVYQASGGAQFVAEVTHRLTIRWPGGGVAIAGGMRVLFGGRMFNVQTVENVQERNRLLYLMCLEINGGAAQC